MYSKIVRTFFHQHFDENQDLTMRHHRESERDCGVSLVQTSILGSNISERK